MSIGHRVDLRAGRTLLLVCHSGNRPCEIVSRWAGWLGLSVVIGVGPARLDKQPAVHAESLAADERGIIAEQEFDGRGDVAWRADSAERSKASPGSGEVRKFVPGAFGVDGPRGHAVDADAGRPEFDRARFGEHLNGALAGRIGRKIRKRDLVGTGADVDDGAFALSFHVTRSPLGAQETAAQIGAKHAIPVGLGETDEGLKDLDGGVVDEGIEFAERSEYFAEDRKSVV